MEILCKRCYLQQMLLRVFSVISGRGRGKRNPGVLFKIQLILSCGSSVMFSNGSRDLYFVSKKPQNHEQKNDSTIDQESTELPISDSCFIFLKKTEFSSPRNPVSSCSKLPTGKTARGERTLPKEPEAP